MPAKTALLWTARWKISVPERRRGVFLLIFRAGEVIIEADNTKEDVQVDQEYNVISITDEDGVEYELEILSPVTYNGAEYMALPPADAPEDAAEKRSPAHFIG